MKKEVIWVIVTAFGLGLIITYGVLTAQKALEQQKPTPPPSEVIKEVSPPPPSQPTPNLTLTIYQPEDGTVLDEKTTLLKGKTAPAAVIAVLTEEDELILEADDEGNFETEIELVDGANEITISAFDEKTNEVSQTLNLVYTETEI